MKMNGYLKSGIVLCTICIIIALALGGVNLLTAPIIEENEKNATFGALVDVYPETVPTDFDAIDISSFPNLPQSVIEAYSVNGGGYVIKCNIKGYKPGMILMFGISPEHEIVGATCLDSQETWGIDKTFGAELVGEKLDSIDGVDAGAQATSDTRKGYKQAAKDAINAAIILGDANQGQGGTR